MTEPEFIERDGEKIVSELIATYQDITGRVLQPGQPERLLINAFAYRELLLRQQIQNAALQTLVSFASAPALDYLGELVGVQRLAASPASCTLRFTLIAGHGGVVIPTGTRVASLDGKIIFRIVEAVDVNTGVNTADVLAFADTTGTAGNGYAAGEISEILDPQPFLVSAENLAATSGGSDEETDAELRDRIKLAPEQFSTAGSVGAYQFHAKSASPAILDVAVTNPTPGTVNIYPLAEGGLPTSSAILNLVAAACNAEKVRPLTDTVVVLTPTHVNYSIHVHLACYTTANTTAVIAQVTENLTNYANTRAQRIGLDIVRAQIVGLCMVDGVYNVTVVSPSADVVISATQVPTRTGSLQVQVTDIVNG
jgi:phage-related baseplate assembly protein